MMPVRNKWEEVRSHGEAGEEAGEGLIVDKFSIFHKMGKQMLKTRRRRSAK